MSGYCERRNTTFCSLIVSDSKLPLQNCGPASRMKGIVSRTHSFLNMLQTPFLQVDIHIVMSFSFSLSLSLLSLSLSPFVSVPLCLFPSLSLSLFLSLALFFCAALEKKVLYVRELESKVSSASSLDWDRMAELQQDHLQTKNKNTELHRRCRRVFPRRIVCRTSSSLFFH